METAIRKASDKPRFDQDYLARPCRSYACLHAADTHVWVPAGLA